MNIHYVNIQGWMYDIGCENLRELVAYAIIFGFSQDNASTFNGSLSYVESILMCSRHTAINVLKSLEDKGLITKDQYEINGVKHNKYSVFAPVVQKLHHDSAEIAHNNKTDNIPLNNNPTLFDNKDSLIISPTRGKVRNGNLDLSFVADEYLPMFEEWLAYKREKKQSYRTQRSLRTCYNSLVEMSRNNPIVAREIVDNSIANNYSGLFPPKVFTYGKSFDERQQEFFDRVNALYPKYIKEYGSEGARDLLRSFYVKWSGQSNDGLYMSWELEKTFDFDKRLELHILNNGWKYKK